MESNEPRDREAVRDATDFAVALSMRGPAAFLTVSGMVDEDATQTLETLLDRLPGADVTEVVLDLTEASGDQEAIHEVSEAVATAAPSSLGVTVVGDGLTGDRA